MERHSLRIDSYENEKANLKARVDVLQNFTNTSQLQQFKELVSKKLDFKQTDDLTDKFDRFFSDETQLLYKEDTKSFILVHQGREICEMANKVVAQACIKYFVQWELQMHRVDVQLEVESDVEARMVITEYEKELTNLKASAVETHARQTKELYRKVMDRALSHINPLRTMNVRETRTEVLEYKKAKMLARSVMDDINRILSRFDNKGVHRNVVVDEVFLKDANAKLDYLRGVLLPELDGAINDIDALDRFTDKIPDDIMTKRHLYTVDDYARWFGHSLEQDLIETEKAGMEVAYNLLAMGLGRDIDQRNAYDKYAQQSYDPTTQLFINAMGKVVDANGKPTVDANGQPIQKYGCHTVDKKGKKCAVGKKRVYTGNFLEDAENNGLMGATSKALKDLIEEHVGPMDKSQDTALKAVVGLGSVYALYKLFQAGREGLGKITGSNSAVGKLFALFVAEAGVYAVSGQTVTGSVLSGILYGGSGGKTIGKFAELVGLKDPVEMEAGNPNAPATLASVFGTMRCNEFAKYCNTGPDGKVIIDYAALLVAHPEMAEHIKALRDSTHKDVIDNYFKKLGKTPEELALEDKTIHEITVEKMREDNKEVIDALTNLHLEPAGPNQMDNWTEILRQYNKTQPMEDRIRKWKTEGLVTEIEALIPRESDLNSVGALFSGLTLAEIKPYVGTAQSKSDIKPTKLRNFMKSKGLGSQYEKFVNKYKGPNVASTIKEVFDIVGLTTTPSPIDDPAQNGKFVEKFILAFKHKQERNNEYLKYVRQNGLVLKDAHLGKKLEFLNDETLTTQRQQTDKLKEYLKNGYFTFEHRYISYLKNQDEINPTIYSRLDTLNEKQRVIFAAMKEKLNADYGPDVHIDFEKAGDKKVKMVFKGNKERTDMHGAAIGKNKMELVIDPSNVTIDGVTDASGKKLSFKDDISQDGGVAGAILWATQYGMIKEVFEGQSTIAGSPDGSTGPFSEQRFGSMAEFTRVGIAEKTKQGLLDMSRSDIIPGNDLWNTLSRYRGSLSDKTIDSSMYEHIPVMNTDAGMAATVKFYNSRMDANGHSIWQGEQERKEQEVADATMKEVVEKGLVGLGIEKGSEAWEVFVDSTTGYIPEWVTKDWDRLKNFLYDLKEGGIRLTGKVAYGVGALLETGVDLSIEGGKMLYRFGGEVVEITTEWVSKLGEMIKNGDVEGLKTVAGYIVVIGAAGLGVAGLATLAGVALPGTGTATAATRASLGTSTKLLLGAGGLGVAYMAYQGIGFDEARQKVSEYLPSRPASREIGVDQFELHHLNDPDLKALDDESAANGKPRYIEQLVKDTKELKANIGNTDLQSVEFQYSKDQKKYYIKYVKKDGEELVREGFFKPGETIKWIKFDSSSGTGRTGPNGTLPNIELPSEVGEMDENASEVLLREYSLFGKEGVEEIESKSGLVSKMVKDLDAHINNMTNSGLKDINYNYNEANKEFTVNYTTREGIATTKVSKFTAGGTFNWLKFDPNNPTTLIEKSKNVDDAIREKNEALAILSNKEIKKIEDAKDDYSAITSKEHTVYDGEAAVNVFDTLISDLKKQVSNGNIIDLKFDKSNNVIKAKYRGVRAEIKETSIDLRAKDTDNDPSNWNKVSWKDDTGNTYKIAKYIF